MSARRLLQLGVAFQRGQSLLGAGLIQELENFLLRGLVVAAGSEEAGSEEAAGYTEENPYAAEENEEVLHR